MLPNLFPDGRVQPEFNSVDASLWYLVAVHEYFQAAGRRRPRASPAPNATTLQDAFGAILAGYARGTRYGIRADADGLLAAGEPGVQLTWMDAKVGDWVVTPRIGKPVEIQALWINALKIADSFSADFRDLLARATESFERRFWNEEAGCLHDVVDVDHRPGHRRRDPPAEPDLRRRRTPVPARDGRARAADRRRGRVPPRDAPRTCAPCRPDDPDYHPHYVGGPLERDGAYHQGTVWPFLQGAFVEAWVRVRGGGAAVIREARERFLAPLFAHLDEAGLGHVSEIADGDPPHTPRGCPFQAWSVGELLRLDRVVLAEPAVPDRAVVPERPRHAGRGAASKVRT